MFFQSSNKQKNNAQQARSVTLVSQALFIREQVLRSYDRFYTAVDVTHFHVALLFLLNTAADDMDPHYRKTLLKVAETQNLFEYYCNNCNQFLVPFEAAPVRNKELRSPDESAVTSIIGLLNSHDSIHSYYLKWILNIRMSSILIFKSIDVILGLDLDSFVKIGKPFYWRWETFKGNINYAIETVQFVEGQLNTMTDTPEKAQLTAVITLLKAILAKVNNLKNEIEFQFNQNENFDLIKLAQQEDLDLSGSMFGNIQSKQAELMKLLHREPRNPKNKQVLLTLQQDLARLNINPTVTQSSRHSQLLNYYRTSSLCYQASRTLDLVNENQAVLRIKQFLFLLTIIGPVIKYFCTGTFNFNKRSVTEYGLRDLTPLSTKLIK